MKTLTRCLYCGGEIELNSLNQYVNIMGDQSCTYAPPTNTTTNHLPVA